MTLSRSEGDRKWLFFFESWKKLDLTTEFTCLLKLRLPSNVTTGFFACGLTYVGRKVTEIATLKDT